MEPEEDLETAVTGFMAKMRADTDQSRFERGLPPWDWSLPFGPPVDLQGPPPGLGDLRFRIGSHGVEARLKRCTACRDGDYSVWDGDPARPPERQACPHVRLERGAIAFSEAGIPAVGGRLGLTLEGFAWKRLQQWEATRARITGWCDLLERPATEPRLLLLWGPTGSGKTHLAAGLAYWAAFQSARQIRPRWLRWRDYLDLCKLDRERRDQARKAGLLVIDELSNSAGAWGATEFEDLLDLRIGAGLATVITTNLDPTERPDTDETNLNCLGTRAHSRLVGFGTPISVVAHDYRLRGKAR